MPGIPLLHSQQKRAANSNPPLGHLIGLKSSPIAGQWSTGRTCADGLGLLVADTSMYNKRRAAWTPAPPHRNRRARKENSWPCCSGPWAPRPDPLLQMLLRCRPAVLNCGSAELLLLLSLIHSPPSERAARWCPLLRGRFSGATKKPENCCHSPSRSRPSCRAARGGAFQKILLRQAAGAAWTPSPQAASPLRRDRFSSASRREAADEAAAQAGVSSRLPQRSARLSDSNALLRAAPRGGRPSRYGNSPLAPLSLRRRIPADAVASPWQRAA